jgi:acetyl-CoA carboxylase biotin carboxyl carrier protein
VRASIVGTFYRAGKPGMAPLVSEGLHVQDSTVIGIIEALQVLTDVEAGNSGTVTSVLATDGQPVEYNQPLLEIQLDG